MTDPQKDDHIEELLGKLQGIFGKLSHSEEEESKLKVEIPATPPPPKEPAKELTPQEAPPAKPAPAAMPSPAATPSPSGAGAYESTVPVEDTERMIVPTAVYFPPGREGEARSLAQKLETMTPRFTKVAFR